MAEKEPAKNPAGAPVPGAWGKEQKEGMKKQQQHSPKQQQAQESASGQQQGDDRTPDQPIGEVAYANRDPAKKKTGEF